MMPKHIDQPDTLEAQVTTPSGDLKDKAQPTTRELDAVLLECNAKVAAMHGDLIGWAKADIAVLKANVNALAESPGERENIQAVWLVAHNMKGLGGSIRFPLLTIVGANLCDLLRDRRTVDAEDIDLVQRHVDAMEMILAQPIMDDGGTEGAVLLSQLRAGSEKRSV